MRLLLLIVSRRRDELESQTGRHPHTRVASVIYEEELEHPRPTGVGRTRGQFSLGALSERRHSRPLWLSSKARSACHSSHIRPKTAPAWRQTPKPTRKVISAITTPAGP